MKTTKLEIQKLEISGTSTFTRLKFLSLHFSEKAKEK